MLKIKQFSKLNPTLSDGSLIRNFYSSLLSISFPFSPLKAWYEFSNCQRVLLIHILSNFYDLTLFTIFNFPWWNILGDILYMHGQRWCWVKLNVSLYIYIHSGIKTHRQKLPNDLICLKTLNIVIRTFSSRIV